MLRAKKQGTSYKLLEKGLHKMLVLMIVLLLIFTCVGIFFSF